MRISTLIVVVLIIILYSCKKTTKEIHIVLSKDEVALEEPLIAKVNDAPAGARYEWQIPSGVPVLQYAKDSSMVKLAVANGIYKSNLICVKVYSGSDTMYTDCRTVKVNTIKFKQDSLDQSKTHQLAAGDQITLQPVLYSTDSSLGFILRTSKNYSCLNSYLHTDMSLADNNVIMSLGYVWFSNDCEPVNMPVASYSSTYHYFKDGVYAVRIYYDNKYYFGTLAVSKFQSRFEFDWLYTSGVLPLGVRWRLLNFKKEQE